MPELIENCPTVKTTRTFPLADDDGVWIRETDDPNELLALLEDPFSFVSRIEVTPAKSSTTRRAVLLDNFVISMDVSATVGGKTTPHYVIDGIDETGFITVRMMSPGGRFPFRSGIDFQAIEKKILAYDPYFVFVRAGQRVFMHLPIGNHPDIKNAILCAAISNQDWLCQLYGKLDIVELGLDGKPVATKTRLNFKTVGEMGLQCPVTGAPMINIIYQGSRPNSKLGPFIGAGMMPSAPPTENACNVNDGTIVDQTVYIGGVSVKQYAPA